MIVVAPAKLSNHAKILKMTGKLRYQSGESALKVKEYAELAIPGATPQPSHCPG
jgi:hypothetical protein